MITEQGFISIQIDNVSEQEILRLREVIHTLIGNGSLNVKGGKVVLNFDYTGQLMRIDHDFCKWIRKR